MKLVQGYNQLLCLLYQPFIILPRLSPLGVLTLDGLPQTLERPCMVVDHERLAPNLAHDGLEYVLVGFAAKKDDLTTRLPVILAGVEVVTMCDRQENNMAGRKDEDPVAFATFTYIEASSAFEVRSRSAFEVRSRFGSNPQTESRSEWTT